MTAADTKVPGAGSRTRSGRPWGVLTLSAAGLLTAAVMSSVDAHAQWPNHPTPGIPRLPDGRPNLSAPAPRTADGKPDLSGVWAECEGGGTRCPSSERHFFNLAKDLTPSDVQMTPWATAIQAQREKREHVDDPFGYCLPPGVPRINFVIGGFKILSTPQVAAFLHETAAGLIFRQVFTDGRPHPIVTEPTWLGYSIGRWESDTFVVESTGFRDGGWLDTEKGHPHSDALRVTERFRRIDVGRMELVVTIDDPKAYVNPWTARAMLSLQPDTELIESFCNNHEKTMEHRRIDPPPPEPASPPLSEGRSR